MKLASVPVLMPAWSPSLVQLPKASVGEWVYTLLFGASWASMAGSAISRPRRSTRPWTTRGIYGSAYSIGKSQSLTVLFLRDWWLARPAEVVSR